MLDEKAVKVLKIRASLLDAARCWLNHNDYTEVQGPTIIPAVGDWPGSFEIKYFDRKAYLAQGLQPYAAAFLAKLGKIYTIAPTFRAEKANDKRHLTEYWRIEVAQQSELETMINVQETLVSHICNSLARDYEMELSYMRRRVKNLTDLKPPFPRLTYDEVIDLLQKDGFDIVWGQRLNWELENHLSLKFSAPFFITEFPLSSETLTCESHPDKPELTLSADLLAPEGYGEVGGGGQIVNKKRLLKERMDEEKIESADQLWYTNFMKNSSVANSGFTTGVERLVQWLCRLPSVKEATAFPRTHDVFYP
jgi:asparaginyl-tRNA synthetase